MTSEELLLHQASQKKAEMKRLMKRNATAYKKVLFLAGNYRNRLLRARKSLSHTSVRPHAASALSFEQRHEVRSTTSTSGRSRTAVSSTRTR